jgi:hypothetical protein
MRKKTWTNEQMGIAVLIGAMPTLGYWIGAPGFSGIWVAFAIVYLIESFTH